MIVCSIRVFKINICLLSFLWIALVVLFFYLIGVGNWGRGALRAEPPPPHFIFAKIDITKNHNNNLFKNSILFWCLSSLRLSICFRHLCTYLLVHIFFLKLQPNTVYRNFIRRILIFFSTKAKSSSGRLNKVFYKMNKGEIDLR